jgi:hypothetical protein
LREERRELVARELAGGEALDVADPLMPERKRKSVSLEEREARHERGPLVPIEEWMIFRDAVRVHGRELRALFG